MKLQAFVAAHIGALEQSGPPRPRRVLRQLIAHRLGIDEATVFAHPERELGQDERAQLERDITALASGYPLAYLYGKTPFLDWTFRIDKRALIPRPETEELVRRVVAGYRGRPRPQAIADLCTGSGVMGLALALAFPEASVTLTDLSGEALSLCRENAALHALEDRVTILQGDLWASVPDAASFDLVVANPPYVAAGDTVAATVSDHEPAMALHGGADGADFLRRLLADLDRRLRPGGCAAFEAGHDHAPSLAPWLDARFAGRFRWEHDPFGVARYLFVKG